MSTPDAPPPEDKRFTIHRGARHVLQPDGEYATTQHYWVHDNAYAGNQVAERIPSLVEATRIVNVSQLIADLAAVLGLQVTIEAVPLREGR